MIRVLCLLAVSLVVICVPHNLIVNTNEGPVQGILHPKMPNVAQYLGIPFAAPPVGNLRFQAAKPALKRQSTFIADTIGPGCPQPTQLGPVSTNYAYDEDCLTIHIWTKANAKLGDNLPVMLFVFGGGFMLGSADEPTYDGAHLVDRGNVVYVLFNYRLGAFAGLALDELQQEDPLNSTGTISITDQQAAMRWVRDNIANFGGDPTRVMTFGQSAGGNSLWAHTVSPFSKGLFRTVNIHSGYPDGFMALNEAKRQGAWFVDHLGCAGSDNVLRCLRGKSVQEILAAQGAGSCFFLPAVDGVIIPDFPASLIKAGMFHRIPIVAGTTLDEGTITAHSFPGGEDMSKLTFNTALRLWGNRRKDVQDMYPLSNFTSPYWALSHVFGDWNLHCANRRAVRDISHHSGNTYLWYWLYPPRENGLYPGGWNLGAYHGAELPFLFNQSAIELNSQEKALSTETMNFWLSQARVGTPVSARWPPYTTSNDVNIALNAPDITMQTGMGIADKCDNLWDTMAPYRQGAVPTCVLR